MDLTANLFEVLHRRQAGDDGKQQKSSSAAGGLLGFCRRPGKTPNTFVTPADKGGGTNGEDPRT